ncbi:MAG: ABC transporter substrate-binding protein, partial [Beijerinckiaceae bacterium]
MTTPALSRRKLLTSAAAGGAAAFMGPWSVNRVQAQAGGKPIVIGITTDASGQYANSGASERRGVLMAIEEANARGGVLG